MNALLLSASKVGDTGYLEHALPLIQQFLPQDQSLTDVVFIPFAGVTITYDDYTDRVKAALKPLELKVKGIHEFDDQKDALLKAKVILIGGGNTFELLNQLYLRDLLKPIQQAVGQGTYYIGWSAGSNVAGQSIRTTNDMPIVQPESFKALNLVPFQLNPHYTDYQAPGHNGETRQMRIEEFMVLNPTTTVVGIQEGSALQLNDKNLLLVGSLPAYLFKGGDKITIETSSNLSHLLL